MKLDQLATRLHAKSRNEVIRNAIKEYTEQMLDTRIIEVREVTVEEAAKLIDNYLSDNPGKHYVSELAEELGIELGTAFRAAQKLMDSGAVKKRRVTK